MLKNAKQTERYKIKLRSVNSGGSSRRLGLYTSEFKEYVQGKTVKTLNIDLGDGVLHVVPSMKTYVNHGSITNPVVNNWLHQHGWTEASDQLLFILEVDAVHQTHSYRFVEHL